MLWRYVKLPCGVYRKTTRSVRDVKWKYKEDGVNPFACLDCSESQFRWIRQDGRSYCRALLVIKPWAQLGWKENILNATGCCQVCLQSLWCLVRWVDEKDRTDGRTFLKGGCRDAGWPECSKERNVLGPTKEHSQIQGPWNLTYWPKRKASAFSVLCRLGELLMVEVTISFCGFQVCGLHYLVGHHEQPF